jgi:hypothetical protein
MTDDPSTMADPKEPDRSILVDCPRCDGPARVIDLEDPYRARLACASCGLSREGRKDPWQWSGVVRMRHGRDGRWKLDRRTKDHRRWPVSNVETYRYFLRAECCGGHTLWARNAWHLDLLEGFVRAPLRSGVPGGYKLPRWIISAKHRDEVLHHLGRMREKLATARPGVGRS